MRLGILEAGQPPEPLRVDFPRYPAMFAGLLLPHLPAQTDVIGYAVIEDEFPDSVTECDAWVITGSAFGVYDPEPFIPRLFDFIRAAADAAVPMVGICFGHQAIAQALGGKATKSDKGWGIGAHRYSVHEQPDWMDAPLDSFETYVSHQDQVTQVPPGGRVIAGSDFCQNAMMLIGDKILTLQSHPEMPSAYVRALYNVRRPRIGDTLVDQALQTITEKPDAPNAAQVARWIATFLTHAQEAH